ncbi:MAG TPA: DNA mismatch repair protein MutS, partial [Ureibacillus sp.]|nr:DNA mismatch repair protein MutS [Ureibacillus sp.]
KRIIQKIELNIPCLSFIDEILKGTNTVERIAASASIMNWLSKHQGMNLIASHDIELTTIAGDLYNNYHFHEIVQDDGVSFDYKIHSGPSTTKNAIKLLEVMEYPSPITELANALANEFEEKREWKLIK